MTDSIIITKLTGYDRIKETARKFYDAKIHNNPEFREKEKQRVREYMNNRYNTDPEYAEKKRQQRRERYLINKQKLANASSSAQSSESE